MKSYEDEAENAEREADRKSQGIPAQLDRLHKTIALAFDRFEVLSHRLEPVLGSPEPSPGGEDPSKPAASTVSGEIVSARGKIELLTERIQELTVQLDL